MGRILLVVKCAFFVIKTWCLENGYDMLSARKTGQQHATFSTLSPLTLHFPVGTSLVVAQIQRSLVMSKICKKYFVIIVSRIQYVSQ